MSKFIDRFCQDPSTKELVRRVASYAGRQFVVTSFRYPDGDFINIYPEDDGTISDCADTIFKWSVAYGDMSPAQKHQLEKICEDSAIKIDGAILQKTVREDHFSEDCRSFCIAVSKISGIK